MKCSVLSLRRTMGAVLLVLFAFGVGRGYADTLFYGGDTSDFIPGYSYAAENMITDPAFPTDIRVYSNFTVPTGETWTINGFFAQIGNPDSAAVPVPNSIWEIRSGMSTSSMGTLLFSGNGSSANSTATSLGFGINGSTPGFLFTLNLPSSITLSGGQTYWMSFAPLDPNYYNMFVGGSTSHANAVGGPLDNYSLIHVTTINGSGPSSTQTWGVDAAEGILGSTTAPPAVPEPSTLLLTGSALMGFLPRLRHQLRRKR